MRKCLALDDSNCSNTLFLSLAFIGPGRQTVLTALMMSCKLVFATKIGAPADWSGWISGVLTSKDPWVPHSLDCRESAGKRHVKVTELPMKYMEESDEYLQQETRKNNIVADGRANAYNTPPHPLQPPNTCAASPMHVYFLTWSLRTNARTNGTKDGQTLF